jgi:hypothetical protein
MARTSSAWVNLRSDANPEKACPKSGMGSLSFTFFKI